MAQGAWMFHLLNISDFQYKHECISYDLFLYWYKMALFFTTL
jgi:hypothetical protein